jgi:hypothetical protein
MFLTKALKLHLTHPPDHLVQTQSGDATADTELIDEDLLLVPTVVFGFSLVDKVWC